MPNDPDQKNPLDQFFFAIADGAPLPWQKIQAELDDPVQLDVLRLLDDVAQAYRAEESQAPVSPRDVMFRWGALEVEYMLGEGGYAEVYRAFDPWLGRHVALKLLRTTGNPDRGLEEARRLARLRHRNILSIYGCAIHDGRAGLWSELIRGRTLAAIVTDDGNMSAYEALQIGHDLALALAVVHAADLVHGDVKAENVMRESGGRIVLMDFGAGGDERLLAGQRLISGTTGYLSPEVLDGAPISAGSDIYALGVLLFYLLSGRYPHAQTDAAQLRVAQQSCPRPDLHALRPELEPSLCALVHSCLASQPAMRPGSAGALAVRFSELLHISKEPAARRPMFGVVLLALAALSAAAVALAWPLLFPPPWDSNVKFLRIEPSGNVELAANSTLAIGDRLRMQLYTTRDSYVYVLNEDAAGNATVLFPQLGGKAQNPQHGGATLQLPGSDAGIQAWEVTAESAREEFVVVASLRALPELETALTGWPRARENRATTRAVGAIVSAPAPLLRGEHLRKLIAQFDHDPAHVRLWQFSFAHRP